MKQSARLVHMLKPSPASALNIWGHKVLGDLLSYFQAEEPDSVLGSWNKTCENPVGLCLLFWSKAVPHSVLPRGRRGLSAVADHSVPRQPCALTGGTGQLDVVGLCLAPEGNFFLLGGWKNLMACLHKKRHKPFGILAGPKIQWLNSA